MILKPWEKKPGYYDILSIYKGEKTGIGIFLDFWQECAGTIDVKAIALDPGKLPWKKEIKNAAAYAILMDGDDLPFHYFVPWFLNNDWKLFYREKDERKRLVNNTFCPWEYELEKRSNRGPGGVVLENDHFLPLVDRDKFVNLFDLLGGRPVLGRTVKYTPGENQENFDLHLRLIPRAYVYKSDNAHLEIKRLEGRIEELEDMKQLLMSQTDQSSKVVSLHIYPETGKDETGSSWRLRQWFKRAADEQLKMFCHTRIVIELGGAEQALHLVFPKDLLEDPGVTLPTSRYTLLLDDNWRKEKHILFTPIAPEALVLYPVHPVPNTNIQEMIRDCLFKNLHKNDILILLRHEGRDYRFAVSPSCLDGDNYNRLYREFPRTLDFLVAGKILTRRKGKYYLSLEQYHALPQKTKMEWLELLPEKGEEFSKLCEGFPYEGSPEKLSRRRKDHLDNEALADYISRRFFVTFSGLASFPLLSEQAELLNAQILSIHTVPNSVVNRKNRLEQILVAVNEDIETLHIKYAGALSTSLKPMWEKMKTLGDAAKNVTGTMAQLEQALETYRNRQKQWEKQLSTLKKESKWDEFKEEVLKIDREMHPESRE